jgi:hypothetical protein
VVDDFVSGGRKLPAHDPVSTPAPGESYSDEPLSTAGCQWRYVGKDLACRGSGEGPVDRALVWRKNLPKYVENDLMTRTGFCPPRTVGERLRSFENSGVL